MSLLLLAPLLLAACTAGVVSGSFPLADEATVYLRWGAASPIESSEPEATPLAEDQTFEFTGVEDGYIQVLVEVPATACTWLSEERPHRGNTRVDLSERDPVMCAE